MDPQISVILPYYNSADTLSESIESILSQQFEDFELLLVDNNSEDESYDLASRFAARDHRIRLLSEDNQGIAHALNRGLAESRGKYIARMDADDISYPERFLLQCQFLEDNPDTGLIACCVNYIHDEGLQYGLFEYVKWNNGIISFDDISKSRFIESPVIHPTVMFRRELFDRFGPYKQGEFPEDYELWLRWLENGVKMEKLPNILLDWRDSSKRLTRTDDRYSTLSFFETKTVFLYNWLKENNPWHPHIVVWGAGRISRQRFALLHDLGVEPRFYIDLRANPTRNVIEYTRTPPAGKHFIVNYVGNREARDKIREFLFDLGYMEGKDFICVA